MRGVHIPLELAQWLELANKIQMEVSCVTCKWRHLIVIVKNDIVNNLSDYLPSTGNHGTLFSK